MVASMVLTTVAKKVDLTVALMAYSMVAVMVCKMVEPLAV